MGIVMTRILILHAHLGSGHRKAAEALAAALSAYDRVEVQLADALEYIHPVARYAWVHGYKRLLERAPALYRMFYALSDAATADHARKANLRIGKLSHRFLARIDRLLAEAQPDVIVCTMQFPLYLMSRMRHTQAITAPLYAVVTDFAAHGSWIAPGVAAYFVPSEATAQHFIAKGVPAERVQITGTPLAPEVMQPKDLYRVRAQLGLPITKPVVSLFGSNLDPASVRTIVVDLLRGDVACTVLTIAGRNTQLPAALSDLTGTDVVTLRQYGTIDFVDDILAGSDLVISKAGGLMTSEALARGVPMILIEPIPGQEEWNADFVVAAGAGVQLHTAEAVAPTVIGVLGDPVRWATMRDRAREMGRPDAAHTIAEQIMQGTCVSAGQAYC